MTETPRHSVSVAAAIFDEARQQVLLIQRRDNERWEPPGGVLELGESIEDGLRREVREETGAEVHVGPLTGVYKNLPRGIVALVFRCELTSAPAPETAEAAQVAWLPLGQALDRMTPAYSVRISDALVDEAPHVRAHDGTHVLPSPHAGV